MRNKRRDIKDFLYPLGKFFIIGCLIYMVFIEGLSCALKKLPTPDGPYAVGLEIHTMQHANTSLWIWYPTNQHKRYHEKNPYGDREELKVFTHSLAKNQPWNVRFFARINQYINLWGSESHAQRNAPLANRHDQYPVIFLIPEGPTPPFLYSAISENLASHGFVVVGINNPELPFGGDILHISGSIPQLQQPKDEDGWEKAIHASLENCVKAVAYVESLKHNRLQQWYHRLALDAYGCCGFAWNGMVPILLCDKDTRCKAGAMINGWVDIKLPQALVAPLLMVHAEPEGKLYIECIRESLRKNNTIESSFSYLKGFSISNANYCSFSDAACLDTPLAKVYPAQKHPCPVLRAASEKLTEFFKENLLQSP